MRRILNYLWIERVYVDEGVQVRTKWVVEWLIQDDFGGGGGGRGRYSNASTRRGIPQFAWNLINFIKFPQINREPNGVFIIISTEKRSQTLQAHNDV